MGRRAQKYNARPNSWYNILILFHKDIKKCWITKRPLVIENFNHGNNRKHCSVIKNAVKLDKDVFSRCQDQEPGRTWEPLEVPVTIYKTILVLYSRSLNIKRQQLGENKFSSWWILEHDDSDKALSWSIWRLSNVAKSPDKTVTIPLRDKLTIMLRSRA